MMSLYFSVRLLVFLVRSLITENSPLRWKRKRASGSVLRRGSRVLLSPVMFLVFLFCCYMEKMRKETGLMLLMWCFIMCSVYDMIQMCCIVY